MTKYQEYFKKMLDENQELFASFREIHDEYMRNSSVQEEYNQAGKPVLEIIKEYEDRLCSRSESGYAAFSGNLADKFWAEVRREFPMVDRIGIIITKVQPSEQVEDQSQESFVLEKIELFDIQKINLN